jgi:hypothetical protein
MNIFHKASSWSGSSLPERAKCWFVPRRANISVRDTLTVPELLPGFELPVKEIFAGL